MQKVSGGQWIMAGVQSPRRPSQARISKATEVKNLVGVRAGFGGGAGGRAEVLVGWPMGVDYLIWAYASWT